MTRAMYSIAHFSFAIMFPDQVYLLILSFADTMTKRGDPRSKLLSILRLRMLLGIPPGFPGASIDVEGGRGFVILGHNVAGDIDKLLNMNLELFDTNMKYLGTADTFHGYDSERRWQ